MIEFDGVKKTYGRKLAVDGLDLSVAAGELYSLLGPNGAGKTTSIKMLVGLLRPTAGTIRVCGNDVTEETREANRHIGYVPDEPYLYDKLTGREFLQFITDMYGLPRNLAAERIAREVDQFELGPFVDDLAETYSHGMKQRVVFASALLHDPDVLVIDEPMVGLDPKSARLVKDLLRDKAEAGMTVFMSTHTLAVAEEISDRIGIVYCGRLRCQGSLAELREESGRRHSSLEELFLQLTSEPQTEVVP
jgi:ABC-2 type transport system ATP-binding protein